MELKLDDLKRINKAFESSDMGIHRSDRLKVTPENCPCRKYASCVICVNAVTDDIRQKMLDIAINSIKGDKDDYIRVSEIIDLLESLRRRVE